MDLLGCQLRQLLQTFLQLQREFLIALLAHRLHVKLDKFILQCEPDVAGGAGEAIHTPGLVKS